MDALNFYIIITPRSLRFLKFALWSLQLREDLSITLVANGLSADENTALEKFCDEIQCGYKQLPTTKVLSHGASLDALIAQHTDPWFCFCDSDIISTDSQAHDIHVGENKAISSCDAMFWDDSAVKGVLGRCNRWPDGSQNLASFFCVYHTETIQSLMAKYKIGFDNIKYENIASTQLQAMLAQKGINQTSRKLDTGKALTAALDLEQQAYSHVDIPSLLHVGGLSSWMLNGDRALVHAEYHLSDHDLYHIAEEGSWLFNLNSQKDPENALFYLRRQQRLAAARYCFQLISHFVDNTPRPTHDLTDTDLVEKLNKITHAVEQYTEHFS